MKCSKYEGSIIVISQIEINNKMKELMYEKGVLGRHLTGDDVFYLKNGTKVVFGSIMQQIVLIGSSFEIEKLSEQLIVLSEDKEEQDKEKDTCKCQCR